MNLEDHIAVTTTATRRPEVLAQTYKSFQEGTQLDFKRMRLFINVDPAPPRGSTEKTLEVARSFFGEVITNTPQVANFAAAVKWLWSTVDSPYVFHLEDDWIMTRPVKMLALLDKLQKNAHVLQVRFRGPPSGDVLRRISLAPGLMRGEVCRLVGAGLVTNRNPEVQLGALEQFGVRRVAKTVALIVPDRPRVIQDIGRAWAKKHGISRPKKSWFTAWNYSK